MVKECPKCGSREILTFKVGRKVVSFLSRLTLGHHHGAQGGKSMEQVACANCHNTYMREVDESVTPPAPQPPAPQKKPDERDKSEEE